MPTLSDARNDIRYLAQIDTHHGILGPEEDGGVTDGWFDRKGYTLLSERAPDGIALVAVALEYPSPCQIDPTATLRIALWLANLDRRDELLPAYVKNIVAINEHMASVGAERVWGLVPKRADHLTGFLDLVAKAGACEKVDGSGIPMLGALDESNDWRNAWFYIGDRQVVTDFMEAG